MRKTWIIVLLLLLTCTVIPLLMLKLRKEAFTDLSDEEGMIRLDGASGVYEGEYTYGSYATTRQLIRLYNRKNMQKRKNGSSYQMVVYYPDKPDLAPRFIPNVVVKRKYKTDVLHYQYPNDTYASTYAIIDRKLYNITDKGGYYSMYNTLKKLSSNPHEVSQKIPALVEK